jgi:hypothetical protein
MKQKKKYLTFTAACLFLAALASISIAQWQPDIRLTNNTAASYTSPTRKNISASGNYIHVVWVEFRDGSTDIYYKRSTDAGISWGSDARLTNVPGYSEAPSVAVYGSAVHVVWEDNRGGNYDIYYKRSTNNGLNWSYDINLTNMIDVQRSASISAGNYVHVVWADERHGDTEIYYKRSINDGLTWDTETRLTSNTFGQTSPIVAIEGLFVHVVFEDERQGSSNTEIYYKRSTNRGVNWGGDIRLTMSPGQSLYPFVSVYGSEVYVIWDDDRIGNREIYYKRSSNDGAIWGSDTRLTNNPFISRFAAVYASGTSLHTVWSDDRNGDEEIYYKGSTNCGSNWSPDYRLTSAASAKTSSSIAVSGPVVNVVWGDNRDGNNEIYYKRNPTGNPFGIKKISSEVPVNYHLFQNYPNPFNPVTRIKFEIRNSKSEITELVIYDILGREIATLVNEQLQPGTYEVTWDGTNYPGGVYFYEMTSGNFTDVKKMLLIK